MDRDSVDEESTRLETHPTYGAVEEEPLPPLVADEEAVARLTRRLRCLFVIITWPIVPLGAVVIISLVYFFYAAIFLDGFSDTSCSHPLHSYAVISIIVILYSIYHPFLRRRFVSRGAFTHGERAARRCDQIFHTGALLYVYGGITLLQTCQDDEDDTNTSTCSVTCPQLYAALAIYIGALELFTFSLILPLLCLPCVYLWFMRHAAVDAEALSLLQERLRDEEAFRRHDNVSARDLLDRLEKVKLMEVGDQFKILPLSSEDWLSGEILDSKECCICMESLATSDDPETAASAVVRTPECHHVFHERCFSQWICGRWQVTEHQRARRTTCPLCRTDLRSTS